MGDFSRDVRLALRSFRRSPGFAAATILVLGIGIGAISLMFSTYNTVVLRPLPYPAPDRLIWIWATAPSGSRNSLSYDDYTDYRDGAEAFQSLGAVGVFSQRRLLTSTGDPEQVTGYDVSASLFPTLGIAPALGRSFVADEEQRGEPEVLMLSHGLWASRYGADPGVVGRTITVDGRSMTVAGVMPADFDFPAGTDIWSPLQRSAGYAQGRGNNNFFAIGRLREGVTIQQAQAQTAMVAAGIAATYPDSKAGWGVELQTLHERYFGPAGASILLLMGIIALVPLVACANVASLFMARAISRRTELAARLTLGAARSRLVRQLLTESLVVALAGGVVGLALAYAGGVALRHFAPVALPRLDAIRVDGTVMGFTLLAALLTVPLFGVLPALRSTDVDIAETLKSGGGRGASEHRLMGRRVLVIAQVALSMTLLLTSGLLLRGYLTLQAEDPGFRTRDVVYTRVVLPPFKYQRDDAVETVWDDVIDHLRAIPGILTVGAVDRQPMSGRGPWNEVWAAQRPPVSAADKEGATRRFVSDGFFASMGIPVLGGRLFGREDRAAGLPVTVVNQALARRFFPDEDPVGQTLIVDWGSGVPLTIVGVVADVREQGLGTDAPPIFYLPSWFSPRLEMFVTARTQNARIDIARAWKATIRALDPDIPVEPIRTIEDRLSTSLFEPKFRSALVAVFALVSLFLSAIGLYGVLSYFVRQHARDLGIRLALGATGSRVARLAVARGMALVGWGVVAGLVGGIVGARVIASRGWLPGVGLYDPTTYVGAAVCLALAGFCACAAPAWRALRIDPAEIMRGE
jgi:putative ABC transport system permease protein